MRKLAERTLRELYDLTERIAEPEITPVLEGSCRIQGPVDESDPELHRTNSVYMQKPHSTRKKLPEHAKPEKRNMFVNDTRLLRAESGTCNVCSAPCSCCMHRTMSTMSSKVEFMSSNNTCGRKEADTCSFIGTAMLPLCKNNACDDPQNAASESSNLLSASSSHDSYSENAESKVTLRAAVAYDASEDVGMPPKVASEEPFGENQSGAHGLHSSCSHTATDLRHRMSLNRGELQVLECHDDNTSCVTGVRDANMLVCEYNLELERKDTSSSSALAHNLLDKEVKKVDQVEAAHGSHDIDIELSQSSARKQSTCPGESYQKKESGVCSEIADLSDKSDFGELCHAKENSSPTVRSSESKFQSGPISAHSADSKDLAGNLISQPLGETLGRSPDNMGSSFGGRLSFGSIDGRKSLALPNCEDGKKNQIGCDSSSGILESNGPYVEAYGGVNGEIPSNYPIIYSSTSGQFANHGAMLEPSIMEGCQMQSQLKTGGENSEPEPDGELDDVKVCDICGDAGREELLAICSRCSDGAEHTYCMRVMLDKIPVGDWLCEECQLKDDHQNKTFDKSDPVSETSKADCLKENHIGSSFNPKILPKLETQASDSKAKGSMALMQNPQKPEKHADNLEVISKPSKKTWETSGGFTGTASPRKSHVLSRETSFKNLEMGKVKPISMAPSPKSQSPNSSQAFSVSQTSNSSSLKVQTQLHSPHGSLLKQSSFNSSNLKPKVKQLIEHVPHKQKISRDSASSNTRKEGVVRTMTKSTSFKSLSSGRTSIESVNKIHSFNSSRSDDPRKLKLVKERNVIEKKNSFNLDRPLVSPSPITGTSLPKVDLKIPQHEGKSSKNKSDSDISNSNRGSNNGNGLGFSEMKQQLSYTSKSFDMCNPEDQNPSQIVPKEGVQANSRVTDRLHREDKVLQRTVSQAADSLCKDQKIKDPTCSSNSKQVASSGSRVSRCHNSKEAGVPSHFCSIDKLSISAVKPSTDRNQREGSNKSNRWKDTAQAALTKSKIQKHKLLDQPEDCSTSSGVVSCGVASEDLSNSICRKDLPLEGTSDGTEVLRSFDTDSNKTAAVPDAQQTRQSVEASELPCAVDLNVTLTDSDELNVKQLNQLFADQSSILTSTFSACVVPEHGFVWQGGFEILRTGRLPELCDGMQAHLSSCASPKVLGVAVQFPRKLKLEEVPCLSSWPSQFQGTSPKEDDIALFFFARDIESYENTYGRLLENMLENDLALRGIINESELLIFPSNKLPANSQCWNSLFFLWGIFRERRTDSLKAPPSTHKKKPSGADLNIDPLVQDTSPPAIYEVNSHENPDKEFLETDRSPKAKASGLNNDRDGHRTSSSIVDGRSCKAHESPFVERSLYQTAEANAPSAGHLLRSFPTSCSLNNQLCSSLGTCSEPQLVMGAEQLFPAVKKNGATYLRNSSSHMEGVETAESPVDFHVNSVDNLRVLPTHLVSSNFMQGVECSASEDNRPGREWLLKNEASLCNERVEQQSEMRISWESRSGKKRPLSCVTEMVTQVSGEILKDTNEMMMGKEMAELFYLEDGREQKKMRCHSKGRPTSRTREGNFSNRLSSKLHPVPGSFSNLQQHGGPVDSEALMHEYSSSVERPLFPYSASVGKTMDNVMHTLSSDDEDSLESKMPDLELALGGKKSSEKEVSPLFFPSVNRKVSQDKLPGPSSLADEDDTSALLALSLAFPGMEKEQTAEPVLKTDQLLRERPRVNTSLLLFGGYIGS